MRKMLAILFCLSTLMGAPSPEEVSEFFDDVLLVINFNHPYYQNIEFFEEIYRPYFKNIVYYGEKSHPGVNVIPHHQGWFFHRAVKDVFKRWPGYKGYIFCQDDCFMNFANFVRLDKEKIWYHSYWSASLHEPSNPWPWWNYAIGYPSIKAAFKKLPQANREILSDNCGLCHVPVAWADFFYVPAHFKPDILQLCSCFDNPHVFLEIGIPTLLLSLDSFENMEHLNACWGGTIQTVDFSQFDENYDWIHPIKFSDPNNKAFIRSLPIRCASDN